MTRLLKATLAAVLLFSLGGCSIKYSASGASIDQGAKTVNIRFVENRAPINNPTLAQRVTERLRLKIQSQTKLAQVNDDNADYEFRSTITGYTVSNAAVTNVDQAATSRLTVTVNVVFIKRAGDKKGWTQPFSQAADFPANQVVSAVENRLLDETILPQLTDAIFNRAFANW
jgi:hypothetical protein